MRVAVLCLLAVPWAAGCGPSGGGSSCVETLPETPRSCDPSSFELVSIPDLIANPGAHFGHYVETVGVADWYTSLDASNACTCVEGGGCTCPTQIALRSGTCGSSVLLGGSYQGRTVECSDLGCWPVTIPLRYAICGTWVPSTTFGEPGMLQVQYVFDR